MEAINLNLIPNGTNPVVHCSQYDEGREFRFNLFDGASVFVLDGTEDITCDIKKPDGNIVTAAVPNTEDDYIIVTTTLQMTACSGNSLGTINISKDGINLYTLNFVLYCERSPLENGIESESSIHNLQTQIGEAVAEQYDAEAVVFDAVPTQGHGTGFAVTSEGVANALDNLPIPDELNDLSDVNISGQAQGEALVWDGSKWVNGTVSTVGNLDDLSDVDTTGKASGDSLRYDGNEWVAKPTTIALTQAEYDALQTKEPNTHYVITDAPNLNATASDIEFSSGVTVKQAIDGIVESGSNANGYYIKYADGTMICTKVQIRGLQPADWNAWGSCYDSEVQDLGTWANTFYNTPVVNVNVSGAGAWIENVWDMSTTACGKLRLVRPSIPGGGITINFQIIGVGRWKA